MERKLANNEHRRRNAQVLAWAVGLLAVGVLAWAANRQFAPGHIKTAQYPMHHNITTTVFWVGEGADASNNYIHNRASAWTEDWVKAYGGIDNPKKRCGFLPCDFKPQENPFYFALPYNDLNQSCKAKPSQREVPWFTTNPPAGDSIIKNRWIQIRHADKIAYAQWEDAGPAGEDDAAYVFGQARPNAKYGLDLSPATARYLGLDGLGQTDWRFVAESSVPDGPWRQTITNSAPECAG